MGRHFSHSQNCNHLTFEGGRGVGGGGIYRWTGIFFWDRYVQDFSSYPITMYDIYFASLLFRSIFFQ
jgi:hypothetical protein